MRRPSAKTFRLAAVTTASAAVTACGLSSAATNNLLAGPSGPPITIGISEPLSGPGQAQGFAADGQACLIGYKLWASDVNSHGGLLGRPVKLIVLNDKGVPALDQKNYQTLITKDHVNLTLAPFSSLLTAGGAALATAKLHYALVAGSAGAPAVYALHDYSLFSTNVPVQRQLLPFAKWVAHLPAGQRPLSAAYPFVNNPFAFPPVLAAKAIMAANSIRTAYVTPGQGYNNLSMSALRADAKRVAASKAQIVVLGSVDVPTVAAFIKEFAALGYSPKYLIAAAGPDQGNAFLSAVGIHNAQGVMVPNGWSGTFPNALSHVMVQDYIARYGGDASVINADVAESYSAGEVIAAAVTATQTLNQQNIISWLHNHTVQTVLGPVAFNSDGENTDAFQSARIFQWQPGQGGAGAQFVQVQPSGLGTSTIIPWAG